MGRRKRGGGASPSEGEQSSPNKMLMEMDESSMDCEIEKTSADYYFDSYSHFGIHEVSIHLQFLVYYCGNEMK